MHYPATFRRGHASFPRGDASGDMLMGETTQSESHWCVELQQDIQVIQFSPFANQNTFYKHGQNVPKLLQDPILHEIGKECQKSAAQVALAWGISKGRCVIPKSVVPWEQEQNLQSDFELDVEDVARIDAIDKKLRFNLKGLNYGWKLYSDLESVDQ
ncbi:Putative NADP-dependent oxidoreductase domain superfamily [Septoria linicola]|uniref:NADP-dependent oxidoreductase domain superfamily n=1 Tax=Septoria linicola TaxID=215465 RepID=A0A9Q9AXX4_9PEZI|nr:Putative NADP-dependent oxidoreductase domain superfamily [Septoria linicola]